jgi:hypothetical protein
MSPHLRIEAIFPADIEIWAPTASYWYSLYYVFEILLNPKLIHELLMTTSHARFARTETLADGIEIKKSFFRLPYHRWKPSLYHHHLFFEREARWPISQPYAYVMETSVTADHRYQKALSKTLIIVWVIRWFNWYDWPEFPGPSTMFSLMRADGQKYTILIDSKAHPKKLDIWTSISSVAGNWR